MIANHQRPRSERGSVLIATVAVVAAVSLVLAAVLTQGESTLKYSAETLQRKQLEYASDAGIAQVRHYVATSLYNASGNAFLQNVLNITGSGVVADPPVKNLIDAIREGSPVAVRSAATTPLEFVVGPCTTRVYIYNVGNGIFRAISIASHKADLDVVARAFNIRERESFSRYIIFREAAFQFGNTTTMGDSHSNDFFVFNGNAINEGFSSFGEFTAVNGFFLSDFDFFMPLEGDPAQFNINFNGPANSNVESRERPQTADLTALQNSVLDDRSPYKILSTVPNGNFWTSEHGLKTISSVNRIEFDDTDVLISVSGANAAGTPITTPPIRLPLPTEGLIYTNLPVQSLSGNLGGRVTLAVDAGNDDVPANFLNHEDSVILTDQLQYIDPDGNHPYDLYQVDADGNQVTGTPVPDIQATGLTPWTAENGLSYEKNPNYLASNPDAPPPVLGIITKGTIRVSENAPTNMIYHAAHITINSAWSATFSPLQIGLPNTFSNLNALRRGNFRHVGSKVAADGGARAATTRFTIFVPVFDVFGNFLGFRAVGTIDVQSGYASSGTYIFDEKLRTNPPPHYLNEDRPFFGPTYDVTTRGTTAPAAS